MWDQSFSTHVKLSEKLTFLFPRKKCVGVVRTK